ncbi:hypothetical protein GCM10009663_49770 [Kitasatospora arboriphila]|uniref:Uncharacterized protein n=1 Tax=Kitasatospora arboriphila TaxID=258052 RepID=A0ABN1TVQ1_9ACTN
MCQGVGSVNLIAAPDILRGSVRRVPIPPLQVGTVRTCRVRKDGTTIFREPTTARTQPACATEAHPEAVTAPDSHPRPPH